MSHRGYAFRQNVSSFRHAQFIIIILRDKNILSQQTYFKCLQRWEFWVSNISAILQKPAILALDAQINASL